MKTQIRPRWLSRLGVSLLLIIMVFSSTRLSLASTPSTSAKNITTTIVPDQMILNGDIATKANTIGHCTES